MKQREALEIARAVLESDRVMGKDRQGNYTVEVTPVRILEALKAIDEALAEPSYDDQQLAAQIMSDCGCSTNNERLLERITQRLANAHPAPEAPAPQYDNMGVPPSCGRPLCSEPDHHPLCHLHKPAPKAQEPEVWFCPDCGTISAEQKQCCPDWIRARKVPVNFANTCAATFNQAIAPSQQAAQTALAWMRPSIYAECQPETTTLREIADEWIAEGHVVTALGPLSQAAPWQELSEEEIWELAKEANLPVAWISENGVIQWAQLEAFRALCVAERDKELMGVGMEPYGWVYNEAKRANHWTFGIFSRFKPQRADITATVYSSEQLAAARLQDQQRIAELEANLKRATAALKAQQLETTCECKNCMNTTEAIIEALKVDYDRRDDVLTVDGVRYSGHIFRTLALCAPGTWLRFEDRRDGVVSVFTPGPEMERAFDVMTGKGAICGT